MAELSPESKQLITDQVKQELSKAQTMPVPGHVTEVVFRMGAPDAVRSLGGQHVEPYCALPCCTAPPLGPILNELEFDPDDEETIRTLERQTNETRGEVLVTLLTRVLAREAQAYLRELLGESSLG